MAEINEENIDPVFRVPSCPRRGDGALTSGEDSPEHRRACEIHQKARAFRTKALGIPPVTHPDGTKVNALPPDEIFNRGAAFAKLITSTEKGNKELNEYRQHLPLIPRERFEKIVKGAAGLTYYDKGSEALVFIDANRDFVYKITPIKELVLDIPAISDPRPIYAKPVAHPLCDQYGNLTVFQRNELFNLLPGLAKTEILAISETQHIITKQPFLGETEPEMGELSEWAKLHGYTILPPQDDDPETVKGTDLPVTEGASSAMPLLFLTQNTGVLGVDVVPRNARRLPGGNVFVFDMTTRPLLSQEIEANWQIKKAMASISTAKKKRRGDQFGNENQEIFI